MIIFNNNNNDSDNDNNNNYGTGVGKVESSAYHREPNPPESGVAHSASASSVDPFDIPVRVTVESQWQLRRTRKLPSNSFSFLMAAKANKGAIPDGLATNQE